ncbi:MAG TPA: hypothetical protein VGK94_07995 [Candidatus Polarisedimenticolia bacterium]
MSAIIGDVLQAPVFIVLSRFAGVAALTWLLTETLPEVFKKLNRFTKPALGAILGPLLSVIFYALGFVRIDFVLAGVLGDAPQYVQAPVRVVGVALMGFIATLCARGFHDWKVGSRTSPPAAPGGGSS